MSVLFFTLASQPCEVTRCNISFNQSSFISKAHPGVIQSALRHIEKFKAKQNIRLEAGLPTSHLESEVLICSHVHHVANLQVETWPWSKFGFSKSTPLLQMCSAASHWQFEQPFGTDSQHCSQTPQPKCADMWTLLIQSQEPSCRAALWHTYKAIFCDVGWQSADESPVIGRRTSETETNRCRCLQTAAATLKAAGGWKQAGNAAYGMTLISSFPSRR